MVSTHLKNISQIESFHQIGVTIGDTWNHHIADISIWGLNPQKEGPFSFKTRVIWGSRVLMMNNDEEDDDNNIDCGVLM